MYLRLFECYVNISFCSIIQKSKPDMFFLKCARSVTNSLNCVYWVYVFIWAVVHVFLILFCFLLFFKTIILDQFWIHSKINRNINFESTWKLLALWG